LQVALEDAERAKAAVEKGLDDRLADMVRIAARRDRCGGGGGAVAVARAVGCRGRRG
jgi:hypothetical protein